jgi:hypothetical protein
MNMENHDGNILTVKSSDSSTRLLWQSYQLIHPVAIEKKLGEINDEFDLRNIFVHTLK